ncbi:MAG: peptide chain release factor N(5)-glutamine methyltransferase [Prevotella sp.]|nr:peptide chain release factor N(5)-glutamine methyltransferase [Prevotella sp.]
MTYAEFWQPLTAIYDAGEARAIAQMVMELHFGLTMADVLCGRMGDKTEMRRIQQRLLTGEPVQYVLGEAEFCGRLFHVAHGVLIPRPETQELCQWMIATLRSYPTPLSILDIGTGSGCIACTLAAEIPEADVTAWDISETALAMARENAKRTNVHVSFRQVDALQLPATPVPPATHYDLIVSNPPYICERERTAMAPNVLDHEPPLALFVPDDDPLLFYRAIADYARKSLKPGGSLFFEINPLYTQELQALLQAMSYHIIETRNDQFGKPRMIRAIQA